MVSRETPAPPAAAHDVFGRVLDKVADYADLLAGVGVARGLLGPREVPRLWSRHLLNCGLVAPAIPRGVRVADIGSGAGLPGLVLAIQRPDLDVTLVEPMLRRASFLRETVSTVRLENVEVCRSRAEDLQGLAVFDVVTARAVARLPQLLGWAWPLVSAGGEMLAIKGASADTEVARASDALRRWDARARIERYGTDVVEVPTTVVRIRAGADGESA